MNKILILDETEESSDKLKDLLEKDGHSVTVAGTPKKVIQELKASETTSLLIAHLEDQSFESIYEVLDKISERRFRLPVLILVPSPTVPKIILTLERGASDIMNLPYHPKVLRAKVKALIRSMTREYQSHLIQSGDIIIDPEKFRVKVKDREVRLTAALFKILLLFIQNPERVFSRTELMITISQDPDEHSRSIDTQIVLLRRLLGPEGKRIKTKRGEGYLLRL